MKLAIFDFDGTLFNSVDDVIICFNKALTLLGFPTLTREEYIERLGGTIDEIISLVLKDNNTPENIDILKKTYLELYNSSKKENTIPFPKAHDLLKSLKEKNVLLAINSNRLNYSLNYFVEKFFSDIDFVLIEGQDNISPPKPHKFGVEKIIKKSGLSKSEVIYIGDSNTDIETAKNAGIECIIVKWGYGNQNDFNNDYILECVDDFSQLLKYF